MAPGYAMVLEDRAPPGPASAEAGDLLRADGVYHHHEVLERHPRAVVWTALPGITWLLPVVGHVGITTVDGRATDFSGPYTVSVNSLMCGPARRVWRLNDAPDSVTYDRAVHDAACVYGKRMHNLFWDNCHSHVAFALNEMEYGGRRDWNMVRVWVALWRQGEWVSRAATFSTIAPFTCILFVAAFLAVSSVFATT
jgi:transmembrane protein 222